MTWSPRVYTPVLLSCVLGGCCSLPIREGRPNGPVISNPDAFTLVIIPDTQKYVMTKSRVPLFNAQTDWIVANKDRLNIEFALHVGDIVENSDREHEWQRANAALSRLDGKVPYVLAVGNHDLDGPSTFFRTRGTKAYNKYFPASRYEDQSWYGGRERQNENDNYYVFFEHNDLKFLIISLEFAPPDSVLQWASHVVASHPDRRVIVLTHCYLTPNNSRVTDWGLINPHNFNLKEVNDGEQMWDKFVSQHENIFLVISGHFHGVGKLTSIGVHGNEVHQVLTNFQARSFYGRKGWMRILQFCPGRDSIAIKTLSPHAEEWLTDYSNEYVLQYAMRHSQPKPSLTAQLRSGPPPAHQDAPALGVGSH